MEEYLGFYVKPSKHFYLKTNILQKKKKSGGLSTLLIAASVVDICWCLVSSVRMVTMCGNCEDCSSVFLSVVKC